MNPSMLNYWPTHFASLYSPIVGSPISSFPSASPVLFSPTFQTQAFIFPPSSQPANMTTPQVIPSASLQGSQAPSPAKGPETETKAPSRKRSNREAHLQQERTRYRAGVQAMDTLRSKIPGVPSSVKLSKIQTLRLAKAYIQHLQGVLDNPSQADNSAYDLQLMREINKRNEYKLPDDPQEIQTLCRSSSRGSSAEGTPMKRSSGSTHSFATSRYSSPDSEPQSPDMAKVPKLTPPESLNDYLPNFHFSSHSFY